MCVTVALDVAMRSYGYLQDVTPKVGLMYDLDFKIHSYKKWTFEFIIKELKKGVERNICPFEILYSMMFDLYEEGEMSNITLMHEVLNDTINDIIDETSSLLECDGQ